MRILMLSLVAITLVSACNRASPVSRDLLTTTRGPDPSGVRAAQALQMPTGMTQLPTPTPGGPNRADP